MANAAAVYCLSDAIKNRDDKKNNESKQQTSVDDPKATLVDYPKAKSKPQPPVQQPPVQQPPAAPHTGSSFHHL